jgi:hypothetical protein
MSFNDVLGHSRQVCAKLDGNSHFGMSEGGKACTKSRVMKYFSKQTISIKKEH